MQLQLAVKRRSERRWPCARATTCSCCNPPLCSLCTTTMPLLLRRLLPLLGLLLALRQRLRM